MLSIEEIKLLIEKLEKIKGEDWNENVAPVKRKEERGNTFADRCQTIDMLGVK